MNPLKELHQFGQSFWYDNIRRGMILSGELDKLIKDDGIRGITSNPTIFEKAIAAGDDYDTALKDLVSRKSSAADIFDELAVQDIQMAADKLKKVYEESGGEDGYVSIEVAPPFAHDTEGTVAEARRLWKMVSRPNAMVKIPATKEGVPAIEKCLSEGININVTLIFSLERYKEVIEAYRSGLEKRAREGKPVAVASVASFFVSRIDSAVDKLLQERIQASQSAREKDMLLELLGKVAVANAKLAYQLFKKSFSGAWFEALKKKGARPQRPLWASTGTKNPHYSDVLYVEALIGPQTVNTIPPATVDAFRDHGKAALTIEENLAEAAETLEKLKLVKIDLKKITEQVEAEGVKLFADSYDKLMAGLTAKKAAIERELSGAKR